MCEFGQGCKREAWEYEIYILRFNTRAADAGMQRMGSVRSPVFTQ